MKQFLSFVRKEFFHVFRDSKTLILLFGMPIVQIILFGFALTNEIKNSKIVICDYANDNASKAIINKLDASRNFEIEKLITSHDDIEKSFKSGKIKLAIIFPDNFENDLMHQNLAKVQIIADASDPNTATTLTGYASSIIIDYQNSLNGSLTSVTKIQTDTRMIYNPQLKGAYNFVPGVMALVLLLVCVLMTSVSIVGEKERGTMEVLLVSPFKPILVVISKAVPYFFLSLVNLTIILILSTTLLDMPINGSIFLLYFASSILIITALALGLLISNSTQSQQTAMVLSLMGMLMPTLLFTGFMFPLENMPKAMQIISNIVPSKWYYIIIKSVMIKGLGITAIWKELTILTSMAVILLAISVKTFKIRLQ
ncbi:ABC transporter permease [Flavobacterium sp. NRK F10]|uniref:ABC transporter permease n=1 Tax=Flavobacterium sp. NRK F10 TaxID=2954931 RepID=UPI0020913D90|nr:ABC transporter permease [Flavobacterium sp. NRK F10]MCO6175913.1 ABC transporter permease [Flavobacterium sp. NRK F10]